MAGSYLSGIFGASPVRPLQKHMEQILACVHELTPFLDAALAGDTVTRDRHHRQIVKLEQRADELKKDLRLHLPSSLFMPFDRRDILEVLTMQDRVAGAVRDIAGIVSGRNMVFPPEIAEDYRKLLATCVRSVEDADDAICELDELIETSFGDEERERVGMLLTKLDATEQLTDEQSNALFNKLFQIEDELKPVDVMFLYRVIDKTSAIADRAQRVGSRMQLMLAR